MSAPGSAFVAGDLVFSSNTIGMPQADGRYFIVSNVAGPSFDLRNPADPVGAVPINSTNWGTYLGGGIVQRVFTIPTPYASSELALLKFSQRTSQMNLTHPNHPPYVLTLISATNWTLAPAVFGSTAIAPFTVNVTASGSGPAFYKYTVTSVDQNGQESQAGAIGHADNVIDLRTTSGSFQISWSPIGGVSAFNVYGATPSLLGSVPDATQFGFIGTTTSNIFIDSNIAPDFTTTPPIHDNPFATFNPGVSAYFQQRLVYGNGGGDEVDHFWMSKPGAYYNFDISNPSQSDDAVDGKLVSLEVNEIKSMIPMPTGLIVLTTKGAWQISGGAGGVATQGGPITPTTLIATAQAYIGANDVPPILINYDILFVQQKGSIIRDLAYNIYSNIYTGTDISILSNHLFYGHQILEWAYAEEPFKIVWCIREDGTLLSLTILKEQDMFGWSRHDTFGDFKSVATVTEGTVDATYFVVDRPNPLGPNYPPVKQIERLAEREFPFGAEDTWAVDAGVKTPANTPNATITMTAPDATGFVGVTANAAVFSSGMIGWILRAGGGILKVVSFGGTTVVGAKIIQPITELIPNDPQKRPDIQPPGKWSIDQPFMHVFGLDHLEGQKVSVLADGGVVNGLTVVDGSITLPAPVTKVVVGLGFQAQLQTMPLDLGQETNTVQGKRKKIGALTVRVQNSRGVKAGRTFDHLVPIKEMNRVTAMGTASMLITGDERVIIDPLWDVPGQICLQVDDPLPVTVLGVIPEVIIGDTVK